MGTRSAKEVSIHRKITFVQYGNAKFLYKDSRDALENGVQAVDGKTKWRQDSPCQSTPINGTYFFRI